MVKFGFSGVPNTDRPYISRANLSYTFSRYAVKLPKVLDEYCIYLYEFPVNAMLSYSDDDVIHSNDVVDAKDDILTLDDGLSDINANVLFSFPALDKYDISVLNDMLNSYRLIVDYIDSCYVVISVNNADVFREVINDVSISDDLKDSIVISNGDVDISTLINLYHDFHYPIYYDYGDVSKDEYDFNNSSVMSKVVSSWGDFSDVIVRFSVDDLEVDMEMISCLVEDYSDSNIVIDSKDNEIDVRVIMDNLSEEGVVV